MSALNKPVTVYFDPKIYHILTQTAEVEKVSFSEIVNEILNDRIAEDEADLAMLAELENEPMISLEEFKKELKL